MEEKVYYEIAPERKGFFVCIETNNPEMTSADIKDMVARIHKLSNNTTWYDVKVIFPEVTKRFEIKRKGNFFTKEETVYLVEHLNKMLQTYFVTSREDFMREVNKTYVQNN